MQQRVDGSLRPAIPASRRERLESLRDLLLAATRVVLTTHVNADGDGAGSEVALAAWLQARGKHVRIVNPTPFPEAFEFLAAGTDWVADAGTAAGDEALAAADLLVVLDTAEAKRIGRVAPALKRLTIAVVDHHPPSESSIEAVGIQDVGASATGELVYDLLRLDEERGGDVGWSVPVLEGLYTAIATDTGSFRFSNTRPRTHAVVSDLLGHGVDPERMYRLIYGTVSLGRVRLLQRSLEGLEIDPDLPLAWITIPPGALEETGTTSEDLDGIVEHARSIRGIEAALLFRRTPDGSTKVSFRSNGDLDVNAIARGFGGGGHVKASGALLGGVAFETARERVLDATREAVRELVRHRGGE